MKKTQLPSRSGEPVKVLFGLNKVGGAWQGERVEMQGDRVLTREAAAPDMWVLAYEKFYNWVKKYTRQ